MTRAELLKEAVVDGLRSLNETERARIVENVEFDLDPLRDRVIAYCPRRRLQQEKPVEPDVANYIEEAIEKGLAYHGFYDIVRIEP